LRSFSRLTMLIGIHFQRRTDYDMERTDVKPGRLITVLGTVVSLGKGVLEHREYVKDTWQRLQESDWDGMGPEKGVENGPEKAAYDVVRSGNKRKRSSEPEFDVDFVEGDSEDSEYDDVELILKNNGGKKRRGK
jgi:hypothetical protein